MRGTTWLTALYKQGHEVRAGCAYRSHSVASTSLKPMAQCSTNRDGQRPDFLASSELLIVTLKARQVSNAVKHRRDPAGHHAIVLIHNGMGTVEELRGVKQPLLLASTTQAARRDGMSSSTLPVAPRISDRQKLRGDYSYLAEVLQSVLPDVARHNNIHSAIWRKLAVNCVINL